jgi:hypothetical protein
MRRIARSSDRKTGDRDFHGCQVASSSTAANCVAHQPVTAPLRIPFDFTPTERDSNSAKKYIVATHNFDVQEEEDCTTEHTEDYGTQHPCFLCGLCGSASSRSNLAWRARPRQESLVWPRKGAKKHNETPIVFVAYCVFCGHRILPRAGHPNRRCPHLILGFSKSQPV